MTEKKRASNKRYNNSTKGKATQKAYLQSASGKASRRKRIKLNRTIKEQAVKYKGGKCSRCQRIFHDICFDFHHIDHTQKEKEITNVLRSRPWREIKAELDKCILVCSNCHRIIHQEDEYSHLKQEPVQTITIQIEMFQPKE